MTPLGWLGRKTSTQTNKPKTMSCIAVLQCSESIMLYIFKNQNLYLKTRNSTPVVLDIRLLEAGILNLLKNHLVWEMTYQTLVHPKLEYTSATFVFGTLTLKRTPKRFEWLEMCSPADMNDYTRTSVFIVAPVWLADTWRETLFSGIPFQRKLYPLQVLIHSRLKLERYSSPSHRYCMLLFNLIISV